MRLPILYLWKTSRFSYCVAGFLFCVSTRSVGAGSRSRPFIACFVPQLCHPEAQPKDLFVIQVVIWLRPVSFRIMHLVDVGAGSRSRPATGLVMHLVDVGAQFIAPCSRTGNCNTGARKVRPYIHLHRELRRRASDLDARDSATVFLKHKMCA